MEGCCCCCPLCTHHASHLTQHTTTPHTPPHTTHNHTSHPTHHLTSTQTTTKTIQITAHCCQQSEGHSASHYANNVTVTPARGGTDPSCQGVLLPQCDHDQPTLGQYTAHALRNGPSTTHVASHCNRTPLTNQPHEEIHRTSTVQQQTRSLNG